MKSKQSAGVVVFNDEQELLLQIRAFRDDTYPGHWDFSAAGGMKPHENHKEAALRELQEELGIKNEIYYLTHISYTDKDVQKQLFLYKTAHNGPFSIDKNEIERVEFFGKHKIQKMIDAKEKFHPEFLLIWEKQILFPSS